METLFLYNANDPSEHADTTWGFSQSVGQLTYWPAKEKQDTM